MASLKIAEENKGLTQIKTVNFNCKTSGGKVTVCYRFAMPLFMCLSVWRRHRYNANDIRTTLKFFPASFLWKLAMLFSIKISPSALKMSFDGSTSLIYGSKAIVISKVVQKAEPFLLGKGTESVLDTCSARIDHVPPLPLHASSATFMATLVNTLKSIDHSKRTLLVDPVAWEGIDIIPLSIDNGAMYCTRVVQKSVFDRSERNTQSLCAKPLIYVVVRDGTQWATVEEAMFFYTGPPSP